jgi:hypothetical protein
MQKIEHIEQIGHCLFTNILLQEKNKNIHFSHVPI